MSDTRLHSISIRHFKDFRESQLSLEGRHLLAYGANGSGNLSGEASLRRALREYVAHYHAERNHQGVGNRLLGPLATVSLINDPIYCRERLGVCSITTIVK